MRADVQAREWNRPVRKNNKLQTAIGKITIAVHTAPLKPNQALTTTSPMKGSKAADKNSTK